ncbi:MAG: radical SAM protein [Syntrophales bacterium]|nr:radical SAM protein [Syntrophales bacterium]
MIQKTKRRFAFGPVPSRRLGRSLGIDIVPFKTCTYDCIYCQLGRTTNKTTELEEYFPVEDVVSDIQDKLKENPCSDYITLSGSGEPTLYSRIRDIIRGIKDVTDIPVAVLTNGSLFWIDDVRDSVLEADLVIPSLDVGNENTFLSVNRPHPDISFSKMVKGLCSFREHFKGPVWLEVFLIGGMTDNEDEILKIKTWVDRIAPERVQINTAVRTPAEDFVEIVEEDKLEEIARLFGPSCEIIADYTKVHDLGEFKRTRDDVLQMLIRRPCSIDDISAGLNLHPNEAVKYVEELLGQNMIQRQKRASKVLYRTTKNNTKNSI